jgi:MerR family transcriptional regulator, light-induced transcriptional regulator
VISRKGPLKGVKITPISLPERANLAERLRILRQRLAAEVTKEFLERHPDWLERYGSRAIERGEQDAIYHLEFLAAAIEAGSSPAFENYARWCGRMLEARGIARSFVIENFEQIRARLRRHFSLEETNFVESFIHAGSAAMAGDTPVLAAQGDPSRLPEQQLFLQAILSPNRKAATDVALGALRAGRSIQDLYLHIFQESLYEVGRLWESNKITVAQEHMATAITQSVMALVYEQIVSPGDQHGKMVVTGVEGELHQIGANMVADVLESDGWDVIFLGTNMPDAGILAAIDSYQAIVIGISVTLLLNIPQVLRLVKSIKDRRGARAPRIILGGAAFRYAPVLASEVGADAVALDLAEALAISRTWKPEAPV